MWTNRLPETVAGRLVLGLAALVVVALAHDVSTAHLPTYGATTGVIAVLTACTRVRMAGGRRFPLQVVVGCAAVQPVVHSLIPHGDGGHGPGVAEMTVIVCQVGLAMLVTVGFSFAERFVTLVSTALRVCSLLLRPCPPAPACVDRPVRTSPDCRTLLSRSRSGPGVRRGPPVPVPVAA